MKRDGGKATENDVATRFMMMKETSEFHDSIVCFSDDEVDVS